MYIVIAYLIGEEKYKQILVKDHLDKLSAVTTFKNLLDEYLEKNPKEIVIALVEDESSTKDLSSIKIITVWALMTPLELKSCCLQALDQYITYGSLNDENITLENVFGSQIHSELIDLYNNLRT